MAIEASAIEALGKIPVETVAILALAVSLFFQGKMSLVQSRSTKELADKIGEFLESNEDHKRKLNESVNHIKELTRESIRMIEDHKHWSRRAVDSLMQK